MMPHCRFVAITVLVVNTNFQMPYTSTTDDFARTSVDVGTVTSEVRVEPSASVTLTSVQVDGLLNEIFVYPTPAGGETKTFAVHVVNELLDTLNVVPTLRLLSRELTVVVALRNMLELKETSVAFVWKFSETELVVDHEPAVEYLVCSVALDGVSHVMLK